MRGWNWMGICSVAAIALATSAVRAGETESPQTAVEPCSALKRGISFDFQDTPLTEVLRWLRDRTDVDILLDPVSMQVAGIDLNQPVTLSLQQVTLKSALRLLLEPVGLTVRATDKALVISQQNESKLETRIYGVSDLVATRRDTRERRRQVAAGLVSMIQEQLSSCETGLSEAIAYVESTESLIATQSRGGHQRIKALLANLRQFQRVRGEAGGARTVSR